MRGLAFVAGSTLLLSACGGSDNGGGSEDTTEVSLMLNWYPYGEHAAIYYGVEQGIYEEHGIDLKIEAGEGSTTTAQAVGQGHVDFGWADTPPVLSNIDEGVKIKSVGVFLQTTPSAVQVFSDSGINEPADLKGKSIAVSAGDAPTTTFPLYLEAVGLDEDDVHQENLDAAGKISAMLAGKVDGLIGFAHDQGPTIAEESGDDVSYMRYSDADLSFYSNGLVASEDMIDDDAELVQEVVSATSEAFEAAVDDPEAAVEAMSGKDPQMPSDEVLLGQWEETIKLLTTDATEGQAPGANAEEDWQETIDVLQEADLVADDGEISKYFDDSFSPEN